MVDPQRLHSSNVEDAQGKKVEAKLTPYVLDSSTAINVYGNAKERCNNRSNKQVILMDSEDCVIITVFGDVL